MTLTTYDAAVIGGGPAGMAAAYAAAENGTNVLLLEKNEKLGKKLYITGKGRCNITNNADIKDFFGNITRNPKFLMSAFNKLSNYDLINLLENNGLRTKVERGGRVFPQSDKSSDVINVLAKMIKKAGVKLALNQNVTSITKKDAGFIIKTNADTFKSKAVIIAAGGLSYPLTGSTGDGYKFAEKFGHSVLDTMPALTPLVEKGNICAQMQGLSLNNVGFKLTVDDKLVFEGLGELLFTHFGLSGPLALSASCFLYGIENLKHKRIKGIIDLKPALTKEKLKNRIVRDLSSNDKKHLRNYLKELLPSKLIEPFLKKSHLNGDLPLNNLKKEMRNKLIDTLKCFEIEIAGVRGFNEAIITAGGINVKELNPSTMESKKTEGLYFVGEVLDVSALTGGYNLQIAFSTGYAAGLALSNKFVNNC